MLLHSSLRTGKADNKEQEGSQDQTNSCATEQREQWNFWKHGRFQEGKRRCFL